MNPFDGYVETEMAIDPSTYQLVEGAGTSGEDQITLGAFSETLCGFMGVWDSGPFYDVLEITEDRLVLHGPIQTGDCQQAEGWFTLTFVAIDHAKIQWTFGAGLCSGIELMRRVR